MLFFDAAAFLLSPVFYQDPTNDIKCPVRYHSVRSLSWELQIRLPVVALYIITGAEISCHDCAKYSVWCSNNRSSGPLFALMTTHNSCEACSSHWAAVPSIGTLLKIFLTGRSVYGI